MSRTSNGLSCRMPRSLYIGRNLFSASSRENENTAWVRSFVPNEKNSALAASFVARVHARTVSIIVPNLHCSCCPDSRSSLGSRFIDRHPYPR